MTNLRFSAGDSSAAMQHRAQRAMARAFMAARGSDRIKAAVEESKPTTTALALAVTVPPIVDPLQPLINRMTNWQRHQWARAGYPKSAKKITEILKMERRNVTLAKLQG